MGMEGVLVEQTSHTQRKNLQREHETYLLGHVSGGLNWAKQVVHEKKKPYTKYIYMKK
jgi:hypothetical protein